MKHKISNKMYKCRIVHASQNWIPSIKDTKIKIITTYVIYQIPMQRYIKQKIGVIKRLLFIELQLAYLNPNYLDPNNLKY
jgi:hypothetical protein